MARHCPRSNSQAGIPNEQLSTLDVRRVPYELIAGNTQGYSYKRDFAINPVAINPTHTLFTS
jgi:hypothetical protein